MEARRVAIIGIGDGLTLPPFDQIEREAQIGGGVCRSDTAQARQIVVVHGEDEIETHEILRPDLPAAQAGDIDAMRPCNRDRARIGWIARMPAAGARRIHRPAKIKLAHSVPERPIGERRTADIAEADKQD